MLKKAGLKMSKTGKKNGYAFLVFFCLLALLVLVPVRCTNVSLVFSVAEGDASDYCLEINGEEAMVFDYGKDGLVGFRVDPGLGALTTLTLSNDLDKEVVITEIRACTGKYMETDSVIWSLENPSYEQTGDLVRFNEDIIGSINKAVSDNGLVKKYLLELLVIGFLMSLLALNHRNKWDRLALWLLCLFECGRWCERFYDQIIAQTGNNEWGRIAKIVTFCILAVVFLVLIYRSFHISSKKIVAGIYVLSVIYICFQSFFYMLRVGSTPDEGSHIAYIAYLEKENVLIPEFDEMKKIDNMGEPEVVFGTTTNYLCHPPLYYQIMRLCRGIEVHGDTMTVHYLRLRVFSLLIALGGLCIFLWIGYTRLSKELPELHLLYNAIIIGVPMSIFNITGVTNDTLALVGCALWFWGAVRFIEDKEGYGTYLLVIGGVCVALFSKLTAGFMLGIATVIFVLWLMIREKTIKYIACRQFLVVIPFALLVLGYFGAVYLQCGAIQPSYSLIDYEGFRDSVFYVEFPDRTVMSSAEYIKYFVTSFFSTWTAVPTHLEGALYKSVPWYNYSRIFTLAVWLLPILAVYVKNRKKKQLFFAAYAAFILTAFLQLYHAYSEYFFTSGYLGAYSSRYYLCFLGAIAFVIAGSLEQIYFNTGKTKVMKANTVKANTHTAHTGTGIASREFLFRLGMIVVSLFLLYSGFVYYLLCK